MQSLLLYAVFFASGISSLICEITWARMLVLVLGNTLAASSVILAAFMGGLVLGSYIGGRYAERWPATLFLYAGLELAIGIYAVASPAFFHPASQLFTYVVTDINSPAVLTGVRLAVAFACLLLPAFTMGATFPAIIKGSEAAASAPVQATRTGYLYSVNTFGGAAGALLAGYVLLPRLGASLTLGVACLVSVFAASGAMLLQSFSGPTDRAEVRQVEPAPITQTSALMRNLILGTTFLIGFVSLSYEVLLTRLVILYFGNSLVVFALVVTAFLLGIGFSALLGTVGFRRIRSPQSMAVLTLISAVCLVIPPFLLLWLSSNSSAEAVPYQDWIVVGIMLVPAFVLGSLLPIAIRLAHVSSGSANITREASTVYAANTLGGMLAAMITNPILVPTLGMEGTLLGLSLICASAGTLLFAASRPAPKSWLAVPAGALLAVAVLSLGPYKLESLYARKLAVYSGDDIDANVKLYHEGAVATAIVLDFPWLGFRDMFLNGAEEASTRFGHVQLFKLLGLLPVLVHESDRPKEGLMIAFGAGIAAGTTLGSGSVSLLECVDLNPDVRPINDLFRDVNGDVLNDGRFQFIAEDGRNYLQRRSRRYDVIISDSTHPRAYDSWILYTEEFYRLVRDHLAPDGVFSQWIPLSDISVEQFLILLKTFRTVFPNSTLWNVYGTDQALLLATPRPFLFDYDRVRSRLSLIPQAVLLKDYQLDTPARIAGFFVMDADNIERFIGSETRIHTDNRPFHQRQALDEFTPLKTESFDRYQANLTAHTIRATEGDRQAMAERQVLARAMQRFFFFGDEEALQEAVLLDPVDGNVHFQQQKTRIRLAMLTERSRRNRGHTMTEVVHLKQVLNQAPGEVQAYVGLAELYLKQHRMVDAESLLLKGLQQAPQAASLQKLLAQTYMTTGRWSQATPLLESVLKSNPADLAARKALVEIHARQQDYAKALDLLQAIGPSGRDDYQYHVTLAGAHFAVGDYRNAEEELSQALRIYPGNTQAQLYLAELYLKTNRPEAGLSQLERVLEVNPYHEASLRRLIGLYRANGRDEKAAALEPLLVRAQALPGAEK